MSDSDRVVGAFSNRLIGFFSVENSELLAWREGLQLAISYTILVMEVECDGLRVVPGLQLTISFIENASLFIDANSL